MGGREHARAGRPVNRAPPWYRGSVPRRSRRSAGKGLALLASALVWRASAEAAAARPRPSRAPVLVVAGRSVTLARISVRFVEARRCRRPVRRPAAGRAPDLGAVTRAGCRTRPRTAAVPLRARGAFGSLDLGSVSPDADGWVRLSVVALEDRLAAAGVAPRAVRTVELGPPDGAAVVRLDRLYDLRGRWHATWIARGVGAAAAFAALRPEHPAASWIRAAAFEALLARQERDFRRALHDPAAAVAFLRRHAWSPYRESVRAALAGAPAVDLSRSAR